MVAKPDAVWRFDQQAAALRGPADERAGTVASVVRAGPELLLEEAGQDGVRQVALRDGRTLGRTVAPLPPSRIILPAMSLERGIAQREPRVLYRQHVLDQRLERLGVVVDGVDALAQQDIDICVVQRRTALRQVSAEGMDDGSRPHHHRCAAEGHKVLARRELRL